MNPSRASDSYRPPAAGPPPDTASIGPHQVALQYTRAAHIVVEGPLTQRRYEFSATRPIAMVDSGDAAALLATRFFVRA